MKCSTLLLPTCALIECGTDKIWVVALKQLVFRRIPGISALSATTTSFINTTLYSFHLFSHLNYIPTERYYHLWFDYAHFGKLSASPQILPPEHLRPRATCSWQGQRLNNTFTMATDMDIDMGLDIDVDIEHVWNAISTRWRTSSHGITRWHLPGHSRFQPDWAPPGPQRCAHINRPDKFRVDDRDPA